MFTSFLKSFQTLFQSPRKIQPTDWSWPLLGLVLLSTAIAIYGIDWGLPDWKGWAADELIPEKVLEAINQHFANGWHYKYPPVHYYFLAILYSPLLVLKQLGWISFENLKIYTLLFYINRSLSVVMGVGTILLIAKLGQQVFDRKTGWLAALGMTLTPLYVYYAKIANLDIPVLFWTIAFLIIYIEILKHHRLRDYVLGAVIAAIAVCTKDQFYGFCILTPFFVIGHFWQRQRQTNPDFSLGQAMRDRRVGYGLSAGIGSFLILQNAIFNFEGFIDRFNLILYGGASIRPRYEESWSGQWEMLTQSFHHWQFSFGWPLWILCLAGLGLYLWQCFKPLKAQPAAPNSPGLFGNQSVTQPVAQPVAQSADQLVDQSVAQSPDQAMLGCQSLGPQSHRPQRNWLPLYLWVPAISYYLFYIAPILYNDVRYLMPIMPIFVLFAGYGMAQLCDRARLWFIPGTMATTLVLVYSLGYSWTINSLMTHDSRYFVEEWMRSQIPPQEQVLEIGIEKYLPRSTGFRVKTIEEPKLQELQAIQPRWIIISSGYDQRRFAQNSPGYTLLEQLQNGQLGYELMLKYQTRPKWYWFDRTEVTYRFLDDMKIYSNFDKIDPEISIYRLNKP